jgi:hypothetical protein
MKIDFVPASYLGLLKIDRLAERQKASLLHLRNLNTAFRRAARRLHTILELSSRRAIIRGGGSPLGSSCSGYFHTMIVLVHVTRPSCPFEGFELEKEGGIRTNGET